VLGRQRTGDETYVEQLLRTLPAAAEELRIAAVTRRPDLVPDGVEPVLLPGRVQELRMAWRLPRLLRRVRPAVGHFIHSLPLACPVPAVVTIQDLSWERDPSVMGRADRWTFKLVVPRAARLAAKVIAISERTRDDLVELYRIPPEKIVVTPLGFDSAFRPAAQRPVRDSGPVEGVRGNREVPPTARTPSPSSPQLGTRPKAKKDAGGGPNPWVVVGAALAVGIVLAKWIDWRGHAHPRD
jgi:hypothetical protein